MDDLSHRLANALVGNDESAAALEITLTGPSLKFLTDCVVAVCGAQADVFGESEGRRLRPAPLPDCPPVHLPAYLHVQRLGTNGTNGTSIWCVLALRTRQHAPNRPRKL
jgi:hypothetical protein